MTPTTVISVPIWDSDEQTQHTLSFIGQMQEFVVGDWLVVIVDNASTSEYTHDFLDALEDSRFHVIRNETNLGYGVAANQGIQYGFECGCEWGIVINNDVIFTRGDWIEYAFLQYLREHKDWLMGVRYIDFNFGIAYDGKNIVPYLEGWLFAFHKDLWVDLGGFDPNLWVWHEDVELCLRAVNAGYVLKQSPAFVWTSVSHCENPPVYHLYGKTGFAKLDFRGVSEVSRQYVIQKHFTKMETSNDAPK